MKDFQSMDDIVRQWLTDPAIKDGNDYIAALIHGNLKANDVQRGLSSVASPEAQDGKVTILVEDRQGKKYRITVEAA